MKDPKLAVVEGREASSPRRNIYMKDELFEPLAKRASDLGLRSISEVLQRLVVAELSGKKSIAARFRPTLQKARLQ